MAIEIRESTVTPGAKADIVQLHISDAPLGAESATFVLTISAEVDLYEVPTLAQLQREAMKKASDFLRRRLEQMAKEITEANYPLNPEPRKRRSVRLTD